MPVQHCANERSRVGNPATINQSAGSPATHTGKRAQCLRFFSVTPRRDEGYHITLLSKPRLTLCAGHFAVGCCDGVRMTVAGWLDTSPTGRAPMTAGFPGARKALRTR